MKNFLNQQMKEFDEKWKRIETTMTSHISNRKIWLPDPTDEEGDYMFVFVDESIKSFLSTMQRQIIELIIERCEGMKKDASYELKGAISIAEDKRDSYNSALSDLSSWLKGELK